MRCRVIWHRETKYKLAELWLRAPDRTAITHAVNRIDRLLADSPESVGEEFYGDRLLVEEPVAVVFSIRMEDRIVEVFDLWHP